MFSFFSKKSAKNNQKNKDNIQVKQPSNNDAQNAEHELVELVLAVLEQYRSETFPKGVLTESLQQIVESQQPLILKLVLPFPCAGELVEISQSLSQQFEQEISIVADYHVNSVRGHNIKGVKNIVAISSGKGGVGKSTTAVNLAYALMAEGASIGILDADIYGPSIPTMLGLQDAKPNSKDGKLMEPLDANGLKAMSIGFLVPDSDATVWRGPMASSAFNQLLNETNWPELDYLLIDMPPGTGDIQLTLAQKVPVAGATVVTTPQDIALADAVKGISMFNKVKVPVLGIVENMSYHICENCGHEAHIFGCGGGSDIADSYQVPLLGQLPLDIAIRTDADLGVNTIIENSTGDIALRYRKIARNMAATLYQQLDMRSVNTPEVVTKN